MTLAEPHASAVNAALAKVVGLAAEAASQNDLQATKERLLSLRMAIITAVCAIDTADFETRRQALEKV